METEFDTGEIKALKQKAESEIETILTELNNKIGSVKLYSIQMFPPDNGYKVTVVIGLLI